jgi:molybdopterin-containing oxidoreductase family iron-sulfur binding subunit
MPDKKEGLNISGDSKPQPSYWKSLKQLYNNPEFIEASHHEFKKGVKDDFEISKLSGISRRKFLALAGASAALAGAGCADYRDKGEIIPYNKKPEEITPGNANYYASYINCKCGGGVLIKTREGRPVKIDGNPDHPVSQGKVCAKCHASILGLYDPERISSPLKKSDNNSFEKIFWEKADREIREMLSNINGKEIAIVTHSITSPTALKALQDFISRYPTAKIYSYELFDNHARNSAWQKSYKTGTFPLIKWDEAKVILSLEGDFLGTEGNHVENSRLFVKGRDISKPENFNRLYVVEGNMSLTGMNADYRLRLRPDAQYELIMSLINEITKTKMDFSIGKYSLAELTRKYSLPGEKLKLMVNDLLSNPGSSIVYAGDIHSEKTQIAVNYLNHILENDNLYKNELIAPLHPLSTVNDFKILAASMMNGSVGAVIHFDSNPVYHLPEDLGYAEALKKSGAVITLTELENETSFISKYVLPINHSLESWGDAKTRTGFYSMQQPVVSPVLDTRQKEAVLLTWIESDSFEYKENLYHEYLKASWQENIYPALNSGLPFEPFWFGALHDGVVRINEQAPPMEFINNSVLTELSLTNNISGFAVALKESCQVGDGRYANNGWLQELPHPVTKVTWDNYAAISDATAKELGVDYNDFIEIEIASPAGGTGRKLKIPVFIQPGAADNTITIELGYGRTHTGTIGKDVGFNANVLLTSSPALSPYLFTSAKVTKPGGSYEIVTAQEHHSFDDELIKDAAERRGIIKEGTVDEYLTNPGFLHEGKEHNLLTLYPEHTYTGLKWGMAIDLNKCTGCSECVVACTAENNIPVVGKDQVKRGREMHWIRVDRYYTGSVDNPKVSNQVMLCQHCDNAPCENVCPVVATTHSPDGLNQMVYNRCVGTRYCSNNCPYKVRRFNFYNFRDHFDDGYQMDNLFSLVYNPEVTVRSRGVMEKCTFCIQRIMEAREDAIKDNRQLKGSDVKTACQEACGTNAISFGDQNDRESEISKYREHKLSYHVLEELNVRPNVTYLAKLRNTHKERV